ncbi:hypothetical protein EPZ47_28805 [Pseudomonas viciae]|uniref:Uncharacterized protein n=1 Tax=Pseudomonas viciae TaxID=2505979 RepID=A0A4P7PQ13_9PSED|nr:hypothetical protein EPZ47_28805 [Pseudomonas viciae]
MPHTDLRTFGAHSSALWEKTKGLMRLLPCKPLAAEKPMSPTQQKASEKPALCVSTDKFQTKKCPASRAFFIACAYRL